VALDGIEISQPTGYRADECVQGRNADEGPILALLYKDVKVEEGVNP
jgi:hypothetical protein